MFLFINLGINSEWDCIYNITMHNCEVFTAIIKIGLTPFYLNIFLYQLYKTGATILAVPSFELEENILRDLVTAKGVLQVTYLVLSSYQSTFEVSGLPL